MTRILIVDDEPHIVSLVSRAVHAEGYDAVGADDGPEALALALAGDIDLIVLDVGLPTMDGFEVLRELRGSGDTTPVIMLTARSGTSDTIEGLDAGASDYVPKPFAVAELMARVRSRLRDSAASAPTVLSRGPVTLDILARRATVDGRDVDLSAREFTLAEQFLRHAGEVLTREVLLSRVWGLDFDPGSNVVDVYVRYLRSKLGPDRIATVRGEGYRWD
ncbi:response regulator transcription factor [Microbacterium sp. EYE_5]|uniref:response regulator transcription factor n=1 Tax=unclassified Microbacterium TaxID=2609290 RepID=UPI0020049B9D|nr:MULTISPECIES: response regulator transcription factor [unclassified Microbacterium]MCK6081094.1 response regulator transcription factor [Microbacterium sp. EYE_382]MCK6086364.1 response regulator transcription factor [Microbacterium sp. EYE_384]MCK6124138.1 response regulator transcription factor [Microbacterium sp. EYE_80]MCK6127047.1 response regulator transcription factor [Microbacterium sp. EYE_79]MCK6142049.1 response regulator transcription factor [Microbacterium sp. EYE_39]